LFVGGGVTNAVVSGGGDRYRSTGRRWHGGGDGPKYFIAMGTVG